MTDLIGPPSAGQSGRPRGVSTCSVDKLYRLHLPQVVSQFIAGISGSSVFVTMLEPGVLRIYPESVWRRNEQLLENALEMASDAADIYFLANAHGFPGTVDKSGRIRLREDLAIAFQSDAQPLRLMILGDTVVILTGLAYERALGQAQHNIAEKLLSLRKRGLQ